MEKIWIRDGKKSDPGSAMFITAEKKSKGQTEQRTWGYCCCWPGRPSMLLMLATAATALASGLSHTYSYKIELTASQCLYRMHFGLQQTLQNT
jgi:hypothetical protein